MQQTEGDEDETAFKLIGETFMLIQLETLIPHAEGGNGGGTNNDGP